MNQKNNLFHFFSISVIILGMLLIAGCKPNIDKLSDAGNVDKLIKALDNKDWEVRRDAAAALGELKDPLAIEPLINTLYDENRNVGGSARRALINIGDPAVESLLDIVEDDYYKKWYGQDPAFLTLADIGAIQTVDYFIIALGDNSDFVNKTASKALQNIGSHAIEPLIAALEDDTLADKAIGVLDKMGWKPEVDIKHFWYWARTYQFNRIIEMGPEAVPLLLELLDNESWGMRKNAAQTLVEFSEPKVIDTLIAWLDEPREDVQIFAAQLLGESGYSQSIESLLAVLKDENAGFELHEMVFISLEELEKPILSELEPIFLALAPICSEPEEWAGIAKLDIPIPEQFYPVVALDKKRFDYLPFEWTSLLLWSWEPDYPKEDLLIACMYQRYIKLEECWYSGAGSIKRYNQIIEVTLRDAVTGLKVGFKNFRSEYPPECPPYLDKYDPTYDTYDGQINLNDVVGWLKEFTP